MSNYTNELTQDLSLITKQRRHKPTAIIKFTKSEKDWYTLWDSNIVDKYNNEKLSLDKDFCMKPYINSYYSTERRQVILDMYDARSLKFTSLIVQQYFQDELKKIRNK